MNARFSGTIFHAVTEIKRRKVTGKGGKSFKRLYQKQFMHHHFHHKQWQISKMKLRITMNFLN